MENMEKGILVLIVWPKIPQMPQKLSAQAQSFWNYMKKKGFIHFATDHSDYFLEALILMNQFNYIIKDMGPDSWKYNEFNALNTKFEKKALDKNHKLFYFSVLKNY